MKITTLIIGFLMACSMQAQEVDLSGKWMEQLETTSGFADYNNHKFNKVNFSSVLSNQERMDNDPMSTYIGVFGPNYRRIDFHLEISKSGSNYLVTGKSKLGDNIRTLHGEMKLKKVLLRTQDYITDSLYICLFDCKLHEPGDRDGDGTFSGVFALVFYIENGEVQLFKTASGDEPNFTNTFVGKWTRNNSSVERKVIFSFHPAGLYESLPYCQNLYTFGENEDLTLIKEEYKEYGWDNYTPGNYDKTDWWK